MSRFRHLIPTSKAIRTTRSDHQEDVLYIVKSFKTPRLQPDRLVDGIQGRFGCMHRDFVSQSISTFPCWLARATSWTAASGTGPGLCSPGSLSISSISPARLSVAIQLLAFLTEMLLA